MHILRQTVQQAGLLAVLLCTAISASAGIIYNNGDILPLVGGANFSEGNGRLGDDFSLGGGDTVRSVQFWGSRWSSGIEPPSDDFNISIYSRSGTTVGALIGTSTLSLVSKIDTGFDHNNNGTADIREYTMDLVSDITLSAGDYVLTVWSESVSGTNFAWQRANNSGTSYHSSNSGASWTTNSFGDNAWNISNTIAGVAVPTPSTLFIAVLGLIGLVRFRRL